MDAYEAIVLVVVAWARCGDTLRPGFAPPAGSPAAKRAAARVLSVVARRAIVFFALAFPLEETAAGASRLTRSAREQCEG